MAVELVQFGRVHLVELPGFAGVPHPDHAMSTQDMGELVASWIADAELTGVLLVGHSMGAQVVVETALQAEESVAHVALIGPPVNLEERSVPRQGLRLLQSAVFEPPAVRRMSLEGYVRCGWRWCAHTLPSTMRYPIEDTIGEIEVPVLVLRGRHDAVAPVSWTRLLAEGARDGRWAEVPGAHSVVSDHAEDVVAHLADLVRR